MSPWPAYATNRVKLPLVRANGMSRITSAGYEQCGYITHISNVRILCIEQCVVQLRYFKGTFPPGNTETNRGAPRLTKRCNLFKGEGTTTDTAILSNPPPSARTRFNCINILFIRLAEVIFARSLRSFVRLFLRSSFSIHFCVIWQAPPLSPSEKSNKWSIEIKSENITTILNFDTLVLSLYYHQYKFNDLKPT